MNPEHGRWKTLLTQDYLTSLIILLAVNSTTLHQDTSKVNAKTPNLETLSIYAFVWYSHKTTRVYCWIHRQIISFTVLIQVCLVNITALIWNDDISDLLRELKQNFFILIWQLQWNCTLCLSCTDVDECDSHLNRCAFRCTNTRGSFTCVCPMGYQLAEDRIHCEGKITVFVILLQWILFQMVLISKWKNKWKIKYSFRLLVKVWWL